jgi:alkanesulfonate monooxygenase SsuD/methylene tetrahydromethanopterin reductase-like flavin-dependent oxidoreductase (luciferase family)
MAAEDAGFHSLGVIDRLVYDNLEPLVALSAAAAVTQRIELFTTVLCAGWRNNPVLLAKQLASIDQISGGRLTAGLGLGGWPDDFTASGIPLAGRGHLFDNTLATLQQAWTGQVKGEFSALPAVPGGGPRVMIGGATPAAYARVARSGLGWVAPGFGWEALRDGAAAVQAEWARAGRPGRPRLLVERYFCLGPNRAADIERYLARYWENAPQYAGLMAADLLSEEGRLGSELARLAEAGCDDLVLLPCASSLDQVRLLAEALQRLGARRGTGFDVAVAG